MSSATELADLANAVQGLREPALQAAAAALQLKDGSHGLDAGCGPGLVTSMLAKVVGPTGRITGLDSSSDVLVHAKKTAGEEGVSDRVSFQQGDVRELPFADDTFDWAWSADCIGYAPMEPVPLIAELSRVVKPEGAVAVLAWSHETLLPGYPALEARLRSTSAGIAPYVDGMQPSIHYLRALGWFRSAGLADLSAHTFAADTHAPLSDDQRKGLEALISMRWPGVKSELSREDFAHFQRLCVPTSSDFILDCPDYYAFFTYTMFCGTVPD